MADPNEVSQFIAEVASEAGSDQDSQLIAAVLPDTGPDQDSQLIAVVAPTTGPDQDSQLIAQVAPTTGPDQDSQLTIELLRGPEVIPPSDNPVGTFTVGAGLGNTWDLTLQLSDSGIELRDKVIKALRATGKFTNARLKVYAYGPMEDINVKHIEDGTHQKCTVDLDDTDQTQQSRRFQVNVKNAMMHSLRIEGNWTGDGLPDRVDELLYEIARQGSRR